jgi:hypothetical protein
MHRRINFAARTTLLLLSDVLILSNVLILSDVLRLIGVLGLNVPANLLGVADEVVE